jgi:hypothetical protein
MIARHLRRMLRLHRQGQTHALLLGLIQKVPPQRDSAHAATQRSDSATDGRKS